MNAKTRLPHLLLSAAFATALVLSGCKPPDDPATAQPEGVIHDASGLVFPIAPLGEGVTRDPSGIVLPLSLPHRSNPAGSKIALCLPDAADPHQRVQINLLADNLRNAEGCELALTDAKGDAGTQAGQLHAFAASRPKAVMVLPVAAAAVKDAIADLRQAGVFVIGLDASLNDGTCDTVVFCDQKKIGAMAGGLIVGALKRKAQESGASEVTGRVVQIQGDENHPSCRARNEGFLSALKAHPGIILVHDAPAKWDKAKAAACFKDALNLQKTIDAVYAQNDMMALGVSGAAVEKNLRENLLIVGTDGITGPGAGLEMLRKSQIDATIHQPLLVDFAWRMIEKMSKDSAFKPQASYEIEPVAFTPKNLEELQASGLAVPPF